MRVLVTEATGKVGQNLLRAFLASDRFAPATADAPRKYRGLEPLKRIGVVKGFFLLSEAFRPAPDVKSRILLMRDRDGAPLRRNPGYRVAALPATPGTPAAARKLFNVSMNQPVDRGRTAALPKRTRGLDAVEIATSFHGNRPGIARAGAEPGWHPITDLEVPIERAWSFEQSPDHPRRI